MHRSADTNQRMFFDVDPAGEFLTTGNMDGSICSWFIGESENSSHKDQMLGASGESKDSCIADSSHCTPLLIFPAHEDCVNGIRYVILTGHESGKQILLINFAYPCT